MTLRIMECRTTLIKRDTQDNDTQNNDTQQNRTQHNEIQHNIT